TARRRPGPARATSGPSRAVGLVHVGAGEAGLCGAAWEIDLPADRDGADPMPGRAHRILADPTVAGDLVHLGRAEDAQRGLTAEDEDGVAQHGRGEPAAADGQG